MPPKVATRLFYLWLVLLLPCFFLAPLSLMAIGDAPGPKAEVLVWSLWTYPVAVGIVGFFKKKEPMIALLPCLNIAACIVSGL